MPGDFAPFIAGSLKWLMWPIISVADDEQSFGQRAVGGTSR